MACEGTPTLKHDARAETPALELELTAEQLHDPETCRPCHAQHVREWQSSMHAYAAQDPVFIAMNERGQQETHGELGDFCVRCHAPLALELGLTHDGLNLPDLKHPSARGVTCYVCHNTTAVLDDHNQHLQLGRDRLLLGGLGSGDGGGSPRNRAAPQPNRAHHSSYSPLHDGSQLDSASLCGSCHDVVNGHGVEIERTFIEWRASRFARPGPDQRTCGDCHMPRYDGRATGDGPERELHRHMFAGVDVALEKNFFGVAAQKAAIDCAFEGALELRLNAGADGTDASRTDFTVQLENRAIGHAFPSGSAQDRRAWVEFIAYDDSDQPFYQSGAFADGEIARDDGLGLRILRDQLRGADGAPVHMFWQAAPSPAYPLGYESNTIAAGETHELRFKLPRPAARVTARLLLRAMGLEVLDDFQGLHLPISERVIDTGYLDDGPIRGRIRTLTVPGSHAELRFEQNSWSLSPPAAGPSDCAQHGYVSLLPID